MKYLNFAYNDMLQETDVNYKRYLKQLLLENMPDVQFIRPPARNQPERICSSHGQSKAVEKSFQNTYHSYQNIFQAAKIVKREILAEEKWQFNGSCDGFIVPKFAWTFVKLDFLWSKKRVGTNDTEKWNWKVDEYFVRIGDEYEKNQLPTAIQFSQM